jgi:hypothetical protein
MRDRLLVRHFWWRFLEHDLISPNTDRHVVLSVIAATLVAVSLFLVILIAAPYQFFPRMPPGIVSLRSLDERFFFTSASMVVLALIAVAQWDALSLDSRDTSALGVLPIPRVVIVRSKFIAVALLAIGGAVAWNLAPTVLRFVVVPPKLGVSFRGMLVLTVAHGVTTIAAGAFGFLAVMGFREGIFAIVGQARFRRISGVLQAGLLVALVTALLLLPGIPMGTTPNWLARGGLTSRALPPLWFVGLHEVLAGSVIDTLPRTRPPRVLVVGGRQVPEPVARSASLSRQREASDLYRSLWPRHRELAATGIAALVIAFVVTTGACLWNSRRLPAPLGRPAREVGTTGRARNWMAAHVVARTSLCQAGFFFALQTMSRQVPHRVALASSVAVGLSLVLIAAQGRAFASGSDVSDVASLPVALLAGQWLLLASLLSGFRHAVRIPAELRASTTFSLVWTGNLTPYISGVKRAGWIALVLPTLGGLFIWHAIVLGASLAALRLGIGLVVSAFLMETLFLRYRRLPFVSAYVPGAELKSRGIAYVAALLSVSFALAWIERLALMTTAGYVTLVTLTIGLSMAINRSSHQPPTPIDDPTPVSALRLDLAR